LNDQLNPYQAPKIVQEIEPPKREASQLTFEDKTAAVSLGCVTLVLTMVLAGIILSFISAFVPFRKPSSAGGNLLVALIPCSWLLCLLLGFFLSFKAATNYLANVRQRREEKLETTGSLERESSA